MTPIRKGAAGGGVFVAAGVLVGSEPQAAVTRARITNDASEATRIFEKTFMSPLLPVGQSPSEMPTSPAPIATTEARLSNRWLGAAAERFNYRSVVGPAAASGHCDYNPCVYSPRVAQVVQPAVCSPPHQIIPPAASSTGAFRLPRSASHGKQSECRMAYLICMPTPGWLGSHPGGGRRAGCNPFREAQPEVGIPKKAIDRKGPMAQHRGKNG